MGKRSKQGEKKNMNRDGARMGCEHVRMGEGGEGIPLCKI